MFEMPNDDEGRSLSRKVMIWSTAAVFIVIGLILAYGLLKPKNTPKPIEIARPGSAEFDSYVSYIKIDKIEKSTAKNIMGSNIGILRTHVTNSGDKVIKTLQLRAVAIGFDSEVLKEKIFSTIPRESQKTLAPNQTILVEIQLDPLPDPETVMEMTLEIYGLKLQ